MLDILIRSGTVIDGTGAPAYRGDVAIEGGRVVAVGLLPEADAERVIDADGKVVCPGFIDVHSHHDLYIVDQDPVDRFGSFLRQGVTTSVVGNCGWSLAPVPDSGEQMLLDLLRTMDVPMERLYWQSTEQYLDYLDGLDLFCNIAQLAAHGSIRIAVMGEANRFAEQEEIEAMQALLRAALEAGCVGLSSGLMYYPGMYAHTEELIELARVAADYGRPYATHLRGYCSTLPDSIGEAVAIGERAGVAVQVSHLHAIPFLGAIADFFPTLVDALEAVNAWLPVPALPAPLLEQAFELLGAARGRGVDVGIDALPYTLGNTTATTLFPPWANRGGAPKLLERLRDRETRARIEHDISSVTPRWPHWEHGSWSDPYIRAIGWKTICVLSVATERNRQAIGKNFLELGQEWKLSPFDALCRLVLDEQGKVAFTFGYAGRPWLEKLIDPVLEHPLVSIGADSIMASGGVSPPSASGCFPRVLGHYARERRLFGLEEAVRKMTSLPARRYHLRGRGELCRGSYADLVVFDPHTVGDSFDEAGRPGPPTGIAQVLVNGVAVVGDGELDETARPGRLLRAA